MAADFSSPEKLTISDVKFLAEKRLLQACGRVGLNLLVVTKRVPHVQRAPLLSSNLRCSISFNFQLLAQPLAPREDKMTTKKKQKRWSGRDPINPTVCAGLELMAPVKVLVTR